MNNSNKTWRGDKIGQMSKSEINAFLAEPWIARLACIKTDGSPFVVPVWYHWDEESFWIVGRKKSRWAEYLEADPICNKYVKICVGKRDIVQFFCTYVAQRVDIYEKE